MTQTELNQFQATLNSKHVELTRAMGRREGIAIERTADALDEVQLAGLRELTTGNLERESRILRDVRAALSRIADGTYGACLECEDEISQKRLRAVPWAALCIGCQEQADRNSQTGVVFEERFLKAA
jgi:DnaK suppressor protein